MFIERLRLVNFRQHEDTELVLGPGLPGSSVRTGRGRRHCSKRSPGALWCRSGAGHEGDDPPAKRLPRAQVRVELEFSRELTAIGVRG
jgi:hypothetical protein